MTPLFVAGLVVVGLFAGSRSRTVPPPRSTPGGGAGAAPPRTGASVLSQHTRVVARFAEESSAAIASAPLDGPRGGRSRGAVMMNRDAMGSLPIEAFEVETPELLNATLRRYDDEATRLVLNAPWFCRDSDGVLWIWAMGASARGLVAWGRDHFGASGSYDYHLHAMLTCMASEFVATGGTDATSRLLWDLDWPRVVNRGGTWLYEGRGSDWVATGVIPDRVLVWPPGDGPERQAAYAATGRLLSLRARWPAALPTLELPT